MPGESLRFIQAGDLHLEQSVSGLSDVPEHLRDRLVDAPFSAAERIFDSALAEQVDFVVFCGDVLDAQKAGPRGLWFMVEQCERLAERKIMVYWAGGDIDPPERWPTHLALPANVRVFSGARMEEIIHRRNGMPVARLFGTSRRDGRDMWSTGSLGDGAGLYTLLVDHTVCEPANGEKSTVDYWALGGLHQRKTLFATPRVAHFAGSPQGRSPHEPGPHGCTLVHVDPAGQARTTPLTTDAVRYHSERIIADESTTRDQLAAQCRVRARSLAAEAEVPLLVTWLVDGRGPLVRQLRRQTLAPELLESLRSEFGHGDRIVWSLDIQADAPSMLAPALYEQDTILGDYLRMLKDYQSNHEASLDIERYFDERHGSSLGAISHLLDQPARQRVLQAAAELGVDLLGGDANGKA